MNPTPSSEPPHLTNSSNDQKPPLAIANTTIMFSDSSSSSSTSSSENELDARRRAIRSDIRKYILFELHIMKQEDKAIEELLGFINRNQKRDYRRAVHEQRIKKERISYGIRRKVGDLYVLDFDGVVCDNCCELSFSAIKTAKFRWPSLFNNEYPNMEAWIIHQLWMVRPVVEAGYENVLLVRLLMETRVPSVRKSSVAEGLTIDGILENWPKLIPVIIEEWGEEREGLIDLFEKMRDEWMQKGLANWIGHNRLYPGISDALKFASSRIYIVTTKMRYFAEVLLRELAGMIIPTERIFGLGFGPKVEVLKHIQNRPENQGLTLHFVEDRLLSLKHVIKEPELHGWNLYLGDWGYSTVKEREEAANIPRIQLIELAEFNKKLKHI